VFRRPEIAVGIDLSIAAIAVASSPGSAEVQFHRPTLLDPERHRRDEFTSGDLSLDNWLRRYAGQNRRGNTAAVWVIADATDTSVTGLGLGTQMIKHILATAVELNVKAACRAVVVTALNPAAFRWRQRFGFDPFDAEDSTNLDLYLLTKDIAATLAKR
jgi:GNAT superfamily N-acetyltransferase